MTITENEYNITRWLGLCEKYQKTIKQILPVYVVTKNIDSWKKQF